MQDLSKKVDQEQELQTRLQSEISELDNQIATTPKKEQTDDDDLWDQPLPQQAQGPNKWEWIPQSVRENPILWEAIQTVENIVQQNLIQQATAAQTQASANTNLQPPEHQPTLTLAPAIINQRTNHRPVKRTKWADTADEDEDQEMGDEPNNIHIDHKQQTLQKFFQPKNTDTQHNNSKVEKGVPSRG